MQFSSKDRERFLSKVKEGPNGCHLWTAGCEKRGYGRFHKDGKTWYAHIIAWLLVNGPEGYLGEDGVRIPTQVIRHKCDNPNCVNPDHLLLGTPQDNHLDMMLRGRQYWSKTHCPHGHEYTPENTFNYRNKRRCRACNQLRDLARKTKRDYCKQGHEFTPENTGYKSNGYRYCLACNAPPTHCKHGHELTEDNISWQAGRRRCKACSQKWSSDYYRNKVK